ncbi:MULTISPECIES: SelT/SelW/SelH family protein [Bradyrhizobium]|jgi:selenoprotein W-related protein|uniref:Selenoprotein W-related protein n=1 Tax=Bradyrhizobium elkanii TaxID=29448 RepID=A0A8I1Y1A1_BRAEL|nr:MULTISPECIES: Rdx family protein [Bradyrhizobium]MBP1291475.1 selenoprotein W-related protein [Bradyrhizobium elkanii]MCP1928214.1 selenoprotein W-related protein [Bradyrhizobium elkanii]MCS3474390.1 selenoprotein W-related protein [Bradyrhizobium elkanii]MCS3581174.1 selenoprotein W-related protein [Bradyrhizobium elkanii]MCS3724049.1 selenoprotein W-related protein [Bradyrhizobium elkanii]
MTNVSITYCRPCGYEKRAKEAAALLRERLGVDATLIPGTGGIFEVKLGDEVVARRAKGHFPDAAEIVAAVMAARDR